MSGNFESRRKRTAVSKALLLVVAFVLVIGISIGGTLAWLTAQTPEVKNTFTSANLFDDPTSQFTLWEHEAVDADQDGKYELNDQKEVKENTYNILPGVDIPKNPTVDIVNLEENAYLYIKVENTLPVGLSYNVDPANWGALTGVTGVWVYKGEKAEGTVIEASGDSLKSFTVAILTDNKVTVAKDYTAPTAGGDLTLTFNAYMVQATGNGANAADAWANTYGTN